MKYHAATEGETRRIAAELAQTLQGGEVIALSGQLGAGKTTFVRGLAKALGYHGQVTSPTYVLLQHYLLRNNQVLVHADLYRLESEKELPGELVEYCSDRQAIVAIEWPQQVPLSLPSGTIFVTISRVNEARIIQINHRPVRSESRVGVARRARRATAGRAARGG